MTKMRKSATKMDGRRSGRTRPWSKGDHRELKRHSKAKTRVSVISRAMKRTVGALRQQALKLGIGLGYRR
jgi:SH3-like domain-containing protein